MKSPVVNRAPDQNTDRRAGDPLTSIQWLVGWVLLVGCYGCSPRVEVVESASLVLEHCQVLSMQSSEVLPNSTVIVDGDVIIAIGPDDSFSLPADAKRIDCEGKYVLPGLTDMHVHIGHPTELLSYLIAGVTTVVNLGGDHIDLFSDERLSVLALRDSVERGAIVGPTLYSAGQALDGDPATGPFQRPLDSVDAARAAVVEQYEAGYDFIKVYDGLDAERHAAIVERANELGLAVFGHIPEAMGIEQTLASGQAVVAHAEEFYPALDEATDLAAAITTLASEIEQSGVAVIPNGAFVKGLVLQLEDLAQQLSRPEVDYLAPAVRIWWEPRYNYYVNRADAQDLLNRSRARHLWIRQLVGELQARGVLLLSGSDASIPVALPGQSLHRELVELVDSGLTPYDALRTATTNVETFMTTHRPEGTPFGIIAVGRRADLILLQDNPLQSLEALDSIAEIVVRGQWIETSTLREQRQRETDSFRTTDR